jgi:hypothetical protein
VAELVGCQSGWGGDIGELLNKSGDGVADPGSKIERCSAASSMCCAPACAAVARLLEAARDSLGDKRLHLLDRV